MDGAFAEPRTVNAGNDREHDDQACSRLSEDKHEPPHACKRAGGAARAVLRSEPREKQRVPLAFLHPGAPRELNVWGALPDHIDVQELARIAKRWSR